MPLGTLRSSNYRHHPNHPNRNFRQVFVVRKREVSNPSVRGRGAMHPSVVANKANRAQKANRTWRSPAGDGSIVVRLRHGVPGRRFIPGPYIARGGVDVNAH
jgi:hypothetical protein